MNIEKIAAKLKPLIPEKVAHWTQAMELADPELKDLIEKQIISTAYSYLGDFHNKILLSLPPEKIAKGAINLGTILYDKEKYPFGISTNELMQNMSILGRSGAGKTNVTFHILAQLIERKIPFVFLDWKRTVRHLIPNFKDKLNIYTPGRALSKFPFNPFVVPPGIESNVYVNQFVDVMSNAFTLGDGSRSLLRKAIATLYAQDNLCPTVNDIISEVEKVPETGRMGGWKITAMRALESLEFSNISSKDRISQEQLTTKLLHENTVTELDALAQESKKFLVPLLCLWLYYVRLNSPDREKLKLVIFLDEKNYFSMLPVGQTIVKLQDRWHRPFLVNFPLMDVRKGAVTDDILARYSAINKAKRAGSGRNTPMLRHDFSVLGYEIGQVPRIPLYDIPLEAPAFAFIEDVLRYSDCGVKNRYKRLGLSTGTGNRLKEQLLEQGWLEDQVVEMGKTRKVLLRLTKQSKDALGLDTLEPQYGSIVHEYWKRFYAQRFREQGYRIEFEASRKSGNVDVLALKDGKSIVSVQPISYICN